MYKTYTNCNENVDYLLQTKKNTMQVICNLQGIIEICNKRILFAQEKNRTTIDNMQNCKNLIQTCEKIIQDKKEKLLHLDQQIYSSCCHLFVEDIIDIRPETTMNITYCVICEYTKP